MKLDLNKITEIYGNNTIKELQNNMGCVIDNITFLLSKDITNVYEILSGNPYIFLEDSDFFKDKVNKMIEKLGVEYVELLNSNISLWGDLL